MPYLLFFAYLVWSMLKGIARSKKADYHRPTQAQLNETGPAIANGLKLTAIAFVIAGAPLLLRHLAPQLDLPLIANLGEKQYHLFAAAVIGTFLLLIHCQPSPGNKRESEATRISLMPNTPVRCLAILTALLVIYGTPLTVQDETSLLPITLFALAVAGMAIVMGQATPTTQAAPTAGSTESETDPHPGTAKDPPFTADSEAPTRPETNDQ